MRPTSIEAHANLVRSGALSEREALVIDTLLGRGPSTAAELDRAAGTEGLWKRMAKLKRDGLVVEAGARRCSVTGRLALQWRLTEVHEVDPNGIGTQAARRRWYLAVLPEGMVYGGPNRADVETLAKRDGGTVELVEVQEVRRK